MKRLELYDDTESTDDVIRVEKSRLVCMQVSYTIKTQGGLDMVETKTSGPFERMALWLYDGYDWILGSDKDGRTILVPLHKK